MLNKDYQDFRELNTLRNTLTNSRSNMSLFTLIKQKLRHVHIKCRNKEDDDLHMFDFAIYNH